MYAVEGFPNDDRHYIVVATENHEGLPLGRYSIAFQLVLRPIPRGLDPDHRDHLVPLIVDPDASRDVQVFIPTSAVSAFPIGAIIHRGAMVSTGPWYELTVPEMEPGTQEYEISTLQEAARPLYRPLPKRYRPRGPNLKDNANADYIRFPAGDVIISVPCYEILRAFYFFDRDVTVALLSEPWLVARDRLVAVREEPGMGAGTLILRGRIPLRLAPFLHLFAHDEGWKTALPSIFPNIVWSSREPGAFIPYGGVKWPFIPRDRTVILRGFGHPDRKKEFVALQIRGFSWKGPSVIRVARETTPTSGSIEGGFPFELDDDPANRNAIESPTGDPITISLDELRIDAARPVNMASALPVISGAPKIERIPPAQPPRRRSQPAAASLSTSTARNRLTPDPTPGRPRTNAGSPVRSRCPRFEEIFRVADAASAAGLLVNSSPVPAAAHPQQRGAWPVWSFPGETLTRGGHRIAATWSHFRDPEGGLQRRSALVLHHREAQDRHLMSITIEPRPGEKATYCSLLFQVASPPDVQPEILDAVSRLLRIGVDRQGVWPEDEALSTSLGVGRLIKWKHWSRPTSADDAADVDIVLSERAFARRVTIALGEQEPAET